MILNIDMHRYWSYIILINRVCYNFYQTTTTILLYYPIINKAPMPGNAPMLIKSIKNGAEYDTGISAIIPL